MGFVVALALGLVVGMYLRELLSSQHPAASNVDNMVCHDKVKDASTSYLWRFGAGAGGWLLEQKPQHVRSITRGPMTVTQKITEGKFPPTEIGMAVNNSNSTKFKHHSVTYTFGAGHSLQVLHLDANALGNSVP